MEFVDLVADISRYTFGTEKCLIFKCCKNVLFFYNDSSDTEDKSTDTTSHLVVDTYLHLLLTSGTRQKQVASFIHQSLHPQREPLVPTG